MKFVEHENALFRAKGDEPHMTEVLVNGQWNPAGKLGLDAGLYGSPLEEDEAQQFAGDDWPAHSPPEKQN